MGTYGLVIYYWHPLYLAWVCFMAWIWCCFPQVACGPRFIKISPNQSGSEGKRGKERGSEIVRRIIWKIRILDADMCFFLRNHSFKLKHEKVIMSRGVVIYSMYCCSGFDWKSFVINTHHYKSQLLVNVGYYTAIFDKGVKPTSVWRNCFNDSHENNF